jgi:hypothetical protein
MIEPGCRIALAEVRCASWGRYLAGRGGAVAEPRPLGWTYDSADDDVFIGEPHR